MDQSLGFLLVDHGFDIWVGNIRGTRWSHGHASLSDTDKVYIYMQTLFLILLLFYLITLFLKTKYQVSELNLKEHLQYNPMKLKFC